MENNIYTKLLDAQKEIGAIKKDSDNPFFHSKYFDINAILREVKPILNKHGLVLTQHLIIVEGKNGLLTAITEADSGVVLAESKCFLPELVKSQDIGSAITYFRRYSLQSLLALEAEDDDGNVASGSVKKVSVANKNVEKFEEDLLLSEEDLIKYDEKLESATNLKELKSIWATLPPMAQDKLAKKKDELKFNLN